VLFLFILFIVRIIDLPLIEDQPFLRSAAVKTTLLKHKPILMSQWVFLENYQFAYENYYQHQTGLYEFYLIFCLLNFTKLTLTKAHHVLFFNIIIILTVLHLWWFNIGVILGSCFLPIFFYFFFVLVDYYEVIEELLAIIKGSS
jgi:hypothetical protein